MSEDLVQVPRDLLYQYLQAVKDFTLSSPVSTGLVPFDLAVALPRRAPPPGSSRLHTVKEQELPVAAGIAVVSRETGRVLMLQRHPARDREDDEHAGEWEFPGGRLEDEESSFEAAQREWEEEVGVKLPKGKLAGEWQSEDGKYYGYVWLVKDEAVIELRDRTVVLDPDHPSGDDQDSIAWWDPAHLPDLEALRDDVRRTTDWKLLRSFRRSKALKELDQLRNFARHGKRIDKFICEWLPEGVLADLSRNGASVEAFRRVQESLCQKRVTVAATASRRARQREQALQPLIRSVAGQLGELVRLRRQRDDHSVLHLLDGGKRTLRDAYAQAWIMGRNAAMVRKQADDEPDLSPDAEQDVDERAQDQEGFLQGLIRDLHGIDPPSDAELDSRLGLYASTLIPVFEAGFRDGVTRALTPDDPEAEGGVIATWMVTSDDPCRLCEAKNGHAWPVEKAPLPGDGDFGEICEGGMRCRCILGYEWTPRKVGPSTTALEAGYVASV